MSKRLFVTAIFFILFALNFSFGQHGNDVSALFSLQKNVFRGDEAIREGTYLSLNQEFLNRLQQLRYDDIEIELPVGNDERLRLHLHRINLLSSNFILRTSENDTLDYDPGLYYIGHIEGKKGICSITLFKDEVVGIVSVADAGSYNLVHIKGGRPDEYLIYNDRHVNKERNFVCHTSDDGLEALHEHDMESGTNRVGECVKMYIEGDYALNQNKGGVVPATNYITALFAQVVAVYDAEQIPLEISEIMVWATQDNYDQNDSGNALDQFEDNNPNFNGDLAHLFAYGGNGTGGLAWVDVLCGWKPYAYSNIDSDFDDYPSYSWSVEVVAHEMGHNMGSRHTHACVWNSNSTQIDDCGNVYADNNGGPIEGASCYDSGDPIIPNDGTIMSYCHLLPGVGINLGLGFGNQPGNLIRNRYNNADCLTECTGGGVNPPEASFESDFTDICAGESIQYFDLSTNNPTSWEWTFEGGEPNISNEENPVVFYNIGGTFDVTLLAANSGGEDELYMPNFVNVYDAPQASFTYEIINGNEVIFTNTSENAEYYLWDFGDGFISSSANPSHVYTFDGEFDVILSAGNDFCSDDLFQTTIQIATMPTAGMDISASSGCTPFVVNFSDNSSANVTSWQWVFEGGNPPTSSIANPTVTYNTPGHFDVSLTVSNGVFQNSISFSDTIHVYQPPVAGFNTVINGYAVTFINTSTNSTSYLWNFGDGNTSTEQYPTHTYAASGTYNVQLTSTSFCGFNIAQGQVTISALPIASFTAETETICVNQSVQFFNTSNTNTVNWIFQGGNPATSTQQNPVVTYNASGSFDVTLQATNPLGNDVLVMQDFITVLQNPTGSVTSSVNQYSVSFNQQMSQALSFLWNFGDGTTGTTINPTHTYANDGNYLATLTINGLCDTITIPHQVMIANPPAANFSHSQVTGCVPLTVQYTNLSSQNTDNILWTFEGGNPVSSQAPNPSVVYANPGTFTVLLEAYNEQGQDVDLRTGLVQVQGVPVVDFTYNVSQFTVNFTYSGNAGYSVLWNFGDGSTSTQQNPTHTYATQGNYSVTMTVSNACGQTVKVKTVSIALLPEAAFSYTPGDGCAPLTVQYTNQSSGSYSQLLWSFEGGTPAFSTSNNPTVNYFTGGTFNTSLIAISTNGNDTLLLEDIITVDDGPDPFFYFAINGSTVIFFNQTEDADAYIWNFGDGTLSSEKEPRHTYTANGTYTVTLFASNDCGQKAKTIQITITTVGSDQAVTGSIKLYPNPNDGNFVLEAFGAEQEFYDLLVYNFMGQMIEKRNMKITEPEHKEYFQMSHLAKGIYIIEIRKGEKQTRIKFVIQ